MAVGNQANIGQINSQMSALAVTLRNNMQAVSNLFTYINELAGDTGLTAGFLALGFSSGDAAAASTLLSNMNSLALIYNGLLQQGGTGGTGAVAFNFGNSFSALWAGQ